jgi:hypothetical protein
MAVVGGEAQRCTSGLLHLATMNRRFLAGTAGSPQASRILILLGNRL